MDIRDWPLSQIMQLPDNCFGRRWAIIFTQACEGITIYRWISETALPNRCVLWELWINGESIITAGPDLDFPIFLKLGDQEPTTDAIVTGMAELLPDSDEQTDNNRVYRPNLHLVNLRLPIDAQGRRVVVRVNCLEDRAMQLVIALVFSSIPTEVPDCLLSAHR